MPSQQIWFRSLPLVASFVKRLYLARCGFFFPLRGSINANCIVQLLVPSYFYHKIDQIYPASCSTIALYDIDDFVSRIAELKKKACLRPREPRRGAPSATSPVSTITTPTGRRRSSTAVAAVRASGTTSTMGPWMGKALVWTFWSVVEERDWWFGVVECGGYYCWRRA